MKIVLKKVKVHNLKSVDLTLDPFQLIVFTGVSGSGKSSLAFDTIYTEGQRRYVESLSTYARRHLGDFPKPEADRIEGISPTIAIEQKTAGRTPRSTVATMTGIYDFLRVLFARASIPHCPVSGEAVAPQSTTQIFATLSALQNGTKLIILSPFARGKKAEFKEEFAELQRKGFTRVRLDGVFVELSESLSIDKQKPHDVDLVIDRIALPENDRLKEAVTQALDLGGGLMSAYNSGTKEELLFSQHAYAKKSGLSYPPLEPHDFSFNHPLGMCPTCQGLGISRAFRLDLVIDPSLSIAEDCCQIAPSYTTVRFGNIYDNLARIFGFKIDTPWKKIPEKGKAAFLYGIEAKWTRMLFSHPHKKARWTEYVQWRGVLHEAMDRYLAATSDVYRQKMEPLMEEAVCPSCKGSRIKPYPSAAEIQGKTIAEITAMPIVEAAAFFKKVPRMVISEELLKEIQHRLDFLLGVGLGYLTLERTAPTLSGGEAQRVRLASQIGSGLVSTTYVLDEPSIGLHPIDNHRLLTTLKALRDQGNTVIVVEHDAETIFAADTVVDIGPLAGALGGEVLYAGPAEGLLKCEKSLTADYLAGRKHVTHPKKKRKPSEKKLTIKEATHHNLKKITVSIPLGLFVSVTGVSGSGKSSLISDILFPKLTNELQGGQLRVGAHKALEGMEHVDKVIGIDQTPIGKTPRSNPATYIKLFDDIRDLFSQLPESLSLGYKPGRFSFNVKEGSCPHCSGMGMVKIDMDFLDDEWTTCSHCEGKRFDDKTLAIRFKGKSIHDVLEMPVSEAVEFFDSIPAIKVKLETLLKVGLDYLRLGQPSPTLSGGEAQRIKLAKELSRPSTGKTIYLMDEPTTGLHFHDIGKLIDILQSLVDRGNTVLVIEHNMDLVRATDWVIELGPEGGAGGGKLLAEGAPEKVAKGKTPTGVALNQTFHFTDHKRAKLDPITHIVVEGASQNNLQSIDAKIPRGQITLCTGPSGSGKSSFAFETIYAEGQRRFVDSMSPFARQFIKQMAKPKIERIDGLSPAIAIEQKNHAGNPRSTVGTMTEAYDFLRILFAYLGTPYSPQTGVKLEAVTVRFVAEKIMQLPPKTKLHILAPLKLKKGESFSELCKRLQAQGYLRIRLNGVYKELDEEIAFEETRKNDLFLVIDRCILDAASTPRLLEAVEHATTYTKGVVTIDADGKDHFFNLAFSDPTTGVSYPSITPHTFSFNTENGMCPDCLGLGFQFGIDLKGQKELLALSPTGFLRHLWKETASTKALRLVEEMLLRYDIDPDLPLKKQPPEHLQLIFHGPMKHKNYEWLGLSHVLGKAAKLRSDFREAFSSLLTQATCLSCQGSRLHPLARHVKIENTSIAEFCRMPVELALQLMQRWSVTPYLQEPFDLLKHKLHFLESIGLGYLSLDRSAPTLSGGETQRIRLSRQLGSGLTGCLYVLDEPTIGLHPKDNLKLNQALLKLKEMGNTLILVEHDPLTMQIADYILDFGPKAGKEGGKITAQGTLPEILKNPHSLTGAYLSGRKQVPVPEKRRKPKDYFSLVDCSMHNLNHLTLNLPVSVFSCLTGVSGSGKSTLLHDILKPFVEKNLENTPWNQLIVLEQNPLGQTSRSDVSTYVDLLTPLRYLFASLPGAKTKGLEPRHFSFNHKRGMCQTCQGHGTRLIQLQFLPPVKITCEACHGFRLNPLSLTVEYKGKHLGHVLQMTALEARPFFDAFPKIVKILDTLIAVGLDYLQLGQEVASLSGGEQQRIRLSRELSRRSSGKTLYLLDEPTVGLHSDDIVKLLKIFHQLVDRGNTLVIIEHNLDVIKNADYLFDLGPGAGLAGGQLIAEGTPEELKSNAQSVTRTYL
ncbi:MAG: excinuclease ABC subunit UvrA [Rhabdochlamydiaceae bacterium]|nr:excinuclease ABC subunit UvrA [Rhabdochlamydiaceae bacterium]